LKTDSHGDRKTATFAAEVCRLPESDPPTFEDLRTVYAVRSAVFLFKRCLQLRKRQHTGCKYSTNFLTQHVTSKFSIYYKIAHSAC